MVLGAVVGLLVVVFISGVGGAAGADEGRAGGAAAAAGGIEKPVVMFVDQDQRLAGTNLFSVLALLLAPGADVVGLGVSGGDSHLEDALGATEQLMDVLYDRHERQEEDGASSSMPTPPLVAAGAATPLLHTAESFAARAAAFGPKGGDGWAGMWGQHRPAGVQRVPGYDAVGVAESDSGTEFDNHTWVLADVHAAELLVQMAREHAGELVVVSLGPLTNVALALALEPRLPELIREIHVMAGALSSSAGPEFNAWLDAESAAMVFRAPWRTGSAFLTPLETCEEAGRMDQTLFDRMTGGVDSPPRPHQQWLAAQRGMVHWGLPLWDELAGLAAVDRERIVAEERELLVDVDTSFSPHYGHTIFRDPTRERDMVMPDGTQWAAEGRTLWRVTTKAVEGAAEDMLVEVMASP